MEKDLEEKFGRCGPIRLITIRASGGVCVPTHSLPGPFFELLEPPEDSHYATIEFSSAGAARKALELHGTWIGCRRIIVRIAIC